MAWRAMAIPTHAPERFYAGDTVKWTEYTPDYMPSDGWKLDVNLTNASENHSVTSSDNSDGTHLITWAVADTTPITPGEYRLTIAATKSGERYTVSSCDITVQPNPQQAADLRSINKQILDNLQNELSNSTGKGEIRIRDRVVRWRSLEELENTIAIYRKLYNQEIATERRLSGKKSRRRLLTRMMS